jgi:hypothetical protein
LVVADRQKNKYEGIYGLSWLLPTANKTHMKASAKPWVVDLWLARARRPQVNQKSTNFGLTSG